MIGQNAIIELRRQGRMPAECWVILHDTRPEFGRWTHPEDLMQNAMAPEVHVMPDENVRTLDLRCLRGMIVHVSGGDIERSIHCLDRISQFDPVKALCAGENWMVGWKPGVGFVDFMERKAA